MAFSGSQLTRLGSICIPRGLHGSFSGKVAGADSDAVTFIFNSAEPSNDDYGQLETIADMFVSDDQFSVEMWVKPNSSYAFGTVAGGGNNAATNWATEDPTVPAINDPYSEGGWADANWIIDGFNNTDIVDGGFGINVYGSGRVRAMIGDGTNFVWVQNPTTSNGPNIVDDAWHQIVFVARYSGASDIDYELWVDGNLEDSVTVTGGRTDFNTNYWTGDSWSTFPANQDNWTFGAEKLSSLNLLDHQPDFKGEFTGLSFWDTAISSTVIADNFSAGPNGLAGDETNLLSTFRHNEGTGTTASDELANSGDITFYLGATETAPTWYTISSTLTNQIAMYHYRNH